MTTPAEYLDQLQKKLGVHSDNALAKPLGVQKQTVSRYRLGLTAFDDKVCIRAAELLCIHPGIVLLHMNVARTRDPRCKRLWKEVSQGFFKAVPPELDRRRVPR